nr:unnamed protein product [Callosobruchus analis]
MKMLAKTYLDVKDCEICNDDLCNGK